MIQLRPDFAVMKDTPYLALTGELGGVSRDIFKEIWPRYIESALYVVCGNDKCIDRILNSKKTLSFPARYGVSFVSILEKNWPCYMKIWLYCENMTLQFSQQILADHYLASHSWQDACQL